MIANYKKLVAFAMSVGVMAMVSLMPATAAEVRLQLKGGGFEITGELDSYDGKKYVVTSPVFGRMSVDGSRFDCIGDNCPTSPVGSKAPRIFAGKVSGDIVIAGSNTIGSAMMPAVIEAFAERAGLQAVGVVGADPLDVTYRLERANGNQAASIRLLRQGSSVAFAELEAGSTEIGMASRRVKPREAARLAAAGLGDMLQPSNEHVIGIDGLLIVVAPDSPAVSMTIDNVAKIFAGEISDWAQLGLPGGAISLYAPTADSGTFETFNDLILKPLNLKASQNIRRTVNLAQQSDWVASDPNGIGIVSLAYLRNAKALNIQTACGLITRPSRFAMKTEEYPLTRRLYLYTPGKPKTGLANQILEFALADDVQSVISEIDFIDQRPETVAFKDQGARIAYALNAADEDFDIETMRSLITDVSQAARLTTTLRFQTGSFLLDAKSLGDVDRLARLLRSDDYKNKQVFLLGFADSVGGFAPNQILSEQRAQTVAAALRKAKFTGAITKGYGELAPVACNDTPQNRNFNRRVEVWIK